MDAVELSDRVMGMVQGCLRRLDVRSWMPLGIEATWGCRSFWGRWFRRSKQCVEFAQRHVTGADAHHYLQRDLFAGDGAWPAVTTSHTPTLFSLLGPIALDFC